MSKPNNNHTVLTEPEKPLVAIKDGKLYQQKDFGLYSGWQLMDEFLVVDTNKMRTLWRGGKISWTLWEQVVSFLRWSQKTYKCEALLTFFYNRKTKEWKAWPFPQHPVGMTVNYITDHPLYQQDRKMFGDDWMALGSIHHHCTANAFQSGTDKSDEEDRDGIHITLGKMDDMVLDTHARQVFDGAMSDTTLLNWIEMPDWCKAIPLNLRWEVFSKAIPMVGPEPAFDPEWKLRVIEKKTYTAPGAHQGSSTYSAQRGSGVSTSTATGKEWRNGRKEALKTICKNLGITCSRAYLLLATTNLHAMPPNDAQQRRILQQECHKVNCPPMWAEDLFSELGDDELTADAHAYGGGYG